MADAASPTLSLAQLRESLWTDARHRVYALVIGSKVPGLRARLAAADVDDWDGLWTGELEPDEREAAPALVTLRRGSAFGDWLLGEAAATFAHWGALAPSALSFLAMRSACRALCKAQLPGGQAIRIDWMDPEVMDALLPVAPADQLQRVIGPGAAFEQLLTLAPAQWTRWSASTGRLVRHSGALAAANA
jgi:hypothetical protein